MPSSECSNPQCLNRHQTAEDMDTLRSLLLAHHIGSRSKVELPGETLNYLFHACKAFRIFDDRDIQVGEWYFSHNKYNGRFSTAKNYDTT